MPDETQPLPPDHELEALTAPNNPPTGSRSNVTFVPHPDGPHLPGSYVPTPPAWKAPERKARNPGAIHIP